MKRLFVLAFLFSNTIHAADLGKKIDTELEKCKVAVSTTPAISDCYQTASESWDVELNNQYKLLMQDLQQPAKTKLKESQRAWVKYKDTYFSGIEEFYRQEQGTIWSLVAAETKLNVIRDKAIDLDRLRRSTDLSGEG